jgi:hypothetical protein
MAYSCRFKNYYAVFVNFYFNNQQLILNFLRVSLDNHAKVADFKAVFFEYILNKFHAYFCDHQAMRQQQRSVRIMVLLRLSIVAAARLQRHKCQRLRLAQIIVAGC